MGVVFGSRLAEVGGLVMWGEMSNPEFEYSTAYRYSCGDDDDIIVFGRCPICGRFIAAGGGVREVSTGAPRFATRMVFDNWSCSRCGPIEPHWDRVY